MTSPVDLRQFRQTMGFFATGVSIIAIEVEGEIHAMTANAITSVSLDPMLVLICIGKHARMASLLQASSGFSINILREDQQALSTFFAGGWRGETPPPFRFVPWQNTPRLEGTLAALGCKRYKVLEGGDHWIVIGEVIALMTGVEPRHPLLFYGGRYGQVNRAERTLAPDLEDIQESVQVFYDPWKEE